ncbi:thiamine phosphate synthase [Galactobacter caseinivorans]|uniref:Thiamine-phosphate synthase n=1 Tax=Galactobacter caseinivorans TaxID=2676123 RepID=A0A496PIK8_9MICC|nr:thiamine phosphate synthase [Galactobacter caseinivorans]RKW70309.1 thiamine phosphate synthase [Galactobacter caseinivorans]
MTRLAPDLRVYTVVDTSVAALDQAPRIAAEAAAGGSGIIQLRAKEAPTREVLAAFIAMGQAVAGRAALVINDRVDVYLAARAVTEHVHGVHVGQSDLPAAAVRALIGPDAILGLSASTAAQAREAAGLGAGAVDHLGVGAIHATPTKPDAPDPLGYGGLADVVAASALPCVGIGGLDLPDAAGVRSAGAAGMAVVRAVAGAPDPRTAAAALLTAWEAAA